MELKRPNQMLQSRSGKTALAPVKAEIIGQVILVFLMICSLLVFVPHIEPFVHCLPCCLGRSECTPLLIVRFSLVYVLSLLAFSFFDLARSFRTRTGFNLWCAKFLIVFAGCCASLYIRPPFFDKYWMFFLLIGATGFIVLHVYVFVRFSYAVIVKLQRIVEAGSDWACRAKIALFIICVISPVSTVVVLIYYYPTSGYNVGFIALNTVIPFIACLWSSSGCVKHRNLYSGYCQGGVFAWLIVFYTWSAIASNPKPECNFYFGNKTFVISQQDLLATFALIAYLIGTLFTYNIYVQEVEESDSKNGGFPTRTAVSEEIVHVYMPKFGGFLAVCAICFFVVTILKWPISDIAQLVDYSKATMGFKLIGCWISVAFFIVTLYSPSLFGIYERKYVLPEK